MCLGIESIRDRIALKEPSDPIPKGLQMARECIALSEHKLTELRTLVQQLCFMVPPDLSAKIALVLSPEEKAFFEATAPFGKLVDDQFPSLIDEIRGGWEMLCAGPQHRLRFSFAALA